MTRGERVSGETGAWSLGGGMNERVSPGDGTARPTARELLRMATRDAHRRVDSSPLMRQLLARDVSLAQYRAALSALAAAHRVLCPRIASAIARRPHPDLDARQLLAPLQQDLDDLGGPLAAGAWVDDPGIVGFSRGLGAWYVLEGAALGGAVITRRVSERLGAEVPLRHFSGAGRGSDRWAIFSAYIDSELATERHRREAVEGAQRAFRCVEAIVSSDADARPP